VPGKKECVVSGSIELLTDILLQKFFLHAGEGFRGIKLLPGKVIAVTAAQVTDGTHRLDEYLEFP
jgi:hypothetical protein